MNPRFVITDGTTEGTVNLFSLKGWSVQEWRPSMPEPKGGGVFRSSPLVDGRRLVYRKMDNVVDTINLVASNESQNLVIADIQRLQRLLEKATSYWTSNWQKEPVWIEAKASNESNTRYAVIADYRLTGFGGPFEQPFFSSSCNSATEAILVLEHGMWQETEPGAVGKAVEASTTRWTVDPTVKTSASFFPSKSAHDGMFWFWSNIYDLSNTVNTIGTLRSVGIIFDNVTIPYDAYVSRAVIKLTTEGSAAETFRGTIITESMDYGKVQDFTDADNFFARKWARPIDRKDQGRRFFDVVSGVIPTELDITRLIQYAVQTPLITRYASPGLPPQPPATNIWESGDKIAVKIDYYSSPSPTIDIDFGCASFWSFDHGADFAELYVEYSSIGIETGQEATAEQDTIVINKTSRAVITHAYYYDANTASYSDNLLTKTPPYAILPAVPAVGDRLYIGSDIANFTDIGPFNNVIFDLIRGGNFTGHWHYYFDLTSGWANFKNDPNASGYQTFICGDGINLDYSGISMIDWEQDNYFGTATVNGVNAYWIYFEVATITGDATPPQQQNRQIYTATYPYLDVAADQVPGDIPALMRLQMNAASCDHAAGNNVVIGLRSLSRGEEFNAYLNASDIQQENGVVFAIGSSGSHLADDTFCPTGRSVHLQGITTNNAWTNICSWSISGIAEQYVGSYHAYMRVTNGISSIGVEKYRLKVVFGEAYNLSYTEESSPENYTTNGVTLLDLGQLVIQPTSGLRSSDYLSELTIYAQTKSIADNVYTFSYLYDIILVPSDEWCGGFGVPVNTGSTLRFGMGLDIDGITYPKHYRAVQTTYIDTGMPTQYDQAVVGDYTKIASGEPILQTNADQRLWFLQFYNQFPGFQSFFENALRVKVTRSSRYLLARGSG